MGAMVVELSGVKAMVLRRALVFCGAHCESGHIAHGHVTSTCVIKPGGANIKRQYIRATCF
jgi:hypothetical protein